jgi:AcrR family transcriptional regulator
MCIVLAMSSAAAPDDLTARARIRDVALRHFAERGVAGATFRGIAADAGVSPGLVQHHFGSKDELRAACDAHVLAELGRQSAAALEQGKLGDAGYIAAAYAVTPQLTRYLVRTLVDGSPAAAALFDEIVRLTEEYLRRVGGERPDLRAQAAVFAAMKLGLAVFDQHLLRTLGARDPARDGYPRIARAALDILAPEFVGADLATQARAGLDRHERATRAKPRAKR